MHTSTRNRIGVCLLALANVSFKAQAQQAIAIPEGVSCSRCSIQPTRLARIGRTGDTVPLVYRSSLLRSGGHYYAVVNRGTGIGVFGADGAFEKLVGRPGDGPAEFRSISRIARTKGDSFLVHDVRGHRLSVLSPSLVFVRSVVLPADPQSLFVLGNGNWLMRGRVGGTTAIGFPAHILSPARELLTSVGTANDVKPRAPEVEWHSAPSSDGGVWLVKTYKYHLEKWSADGKKILSIDRTAAWFPGMDSLTHEAAVAIQAGRAVSPPTIMGMMDLGNDLVMVIIARSKQTALDAYAYVEVLDTRAGRVMAVTSLPTFIHFVTDGISYHWAKDTEGFDYFEAWSLRFNNPSQEQK